MAATPAPVEREIVPLAFVEGDLRIEEWHVNSLPPDISYCLDAEVEMGNLGGDDRAFVDLFDTGTVEWFDGISHGHAPRFPDVVMSRHAAWRATARPEDAMAVDWAGLGSLRWLFDDCCLGIAGELWSASEGSDRRTPLSPVEIVARLPSSPDAARFLARATPVVGRALDDIGRWGVERFTACRTVLSELYQARATAIGARDRAIMASATRRKAGAAATKLGSAERRNARRKESLARRALAKSYATLEGFAGRSRAKAWLSGDHVTVEGRRFDFRLRVADVRRTSHGAVEVSVTDKDGIELASLCVYAPSTPALDQITSFVLHVVAGEEDEILRKANVIRSTAHAAGNEAFVEIRGKPHRLPDVPAFPGFDVEREIVDLRAEDDARQAYLSELRPAFAAWLTAGVLAPLQDLLPERDGILRDVHRDPRRLAA